MARSDFLQAYARFQKALTDYNNLIAQIEDRADLLRIQFSVAATDMSILYQNARTQQHLNDVISAAKAKELSLADDAKHLSLAADALADALPKVVGLATDWSGPLRGAIKAAALAEIQNLDSQIEDTNATEVAAQQDKEIASLQEQIALTADKDLADLTADLQQLQELIRQEASSRLELFAQAEAMQQMVGRYEAALASGERLLEDRLRFRQQTAAQVQQYRYKDMAFRIFRNDALQKYRAQFDLAAMYVYLAARAYDYETDFQENDPVNHPGAEFMTSIIGSQALGIIQNGNPQLAPTTGDGGLADPLAKLIGNWQVLKSQLGFNNPLNEITPFSLRYELFRIQKSSAGSKTWQATLSRCVVPNLLDLPEYKRFCRPLPNALPVEPAIVIPFATSINLGYNLFGWPSAPGDHTYPSTYFATKIRSVGVWFANYNNSALVSTPQVYLIPVGEDVMRSPSSTDIRSWRILDQALPAPNPFSSTALNDPGWFPESPGIELGGTIGEPLIYAELPAYTDAGGFSSSQVTSSSRLIGRSVWNTRWLLIIPAAELLNDRNEALQRFINGTLLPDGTRAGNGVTDIEIYFQTYAYSGN
jgi:hypothetical protein